MTLVDDVKARSDIVQVISQYADLDTRSRTPKAPCPFHAERTASFVVFPDTGTWRCFGACSTGGDVISFVMRKENLQFGEALKMLAPILWVFGKVVLDGVLMKERNLQLV